MLFVRRASFLYQSRKGISDGISNKVNQILTLAQDVTNSSRKLHKNTFQTLAEMIGESDGQLKARRVGGGE